ncbi:hypothetical protein SAMN05660653_03205 [Desulfonatronum thiosulfatophilum]|uniref:Membrane-anchored ribosome-binding protein, inhibits growth in stationary phase, ElaB/YqjD/DUF883 family n=1 Tax=Desulfonatronum thiosulfatophilum TaxID=617002 RepID=A0A1G6EVT8_9BACT|nr:hypothetical protein [Desulfonatronum thiosulfatophilum]SDB61518.1 hypothetical protein SAMN05660653_03205 [Desulfonatronum thiosulfatophilum]
MDYQRYDKPDLTAAEPQASGKPTAFENVKKTLADQLDAAAEALGGKTGDQVGHEAVAEYGNQASEWLGKSADYVRKFDLEQADADVRECIRQHPGPSLLAAGVVGFLVGAMIRRR